MSVASAPDLELRDDNECTNYLDTMSIAARSSYEVHGTASRRKQKFTEKGRAFQKDLISRKREKAFLALKREVNDTKSLYDRPETEMNDLENQRDRLDQLKDYFNDTQREYDNLLETPSEREASYQWFDVRDREFTEFRTRLCEKIHSIEGSIHRSGSSVTSRSRRSHVSRRSSQHSSRLSVSHARAKAAATAAQSRVELEFLERDNESKRLQIEKRYALARAREKAFKEILDEENTKEIKMASIPEDQIPRNMLTANVKREEIAEPKLDPKVPPFVPYTKLDEIKPESKQTEVKNDFTQQNTTANIVKQNENVSSALNQLINLQAMQTQLSSLLINQQRVSHLPVKEPPTFSGDAFEYPTFTTAFDAIIGTNVSTDKDRLYYLEKYTTGKANEVIKGFLATNSETAYTEARKLLDQRFGNPEIVAENFKSRLRCWRQISDGDSTGLQEFSDFLIRCEEAMKTMNSLMELNSSQFLMLMSAKLPSYSGVKWCRHAHDLRAKGDVTFRNFTAFVKQEAEVANDPVFSPDVLKRERKKTNPKDSLSFKPKRRADNSTAQTFASTVVPGRQSANQDQKPCPECGGRHAFSKCQKFVSASVDDRHEMVKVKGLCFRCLRPGHVSAKCVSKANCGECSKHHHTLLHGAKGKVTKQEQSNDGAPNKAPHLTRVPAAENAQSNATSVTHSTDSDPDAITTCRIVQVILHHKNNPSAKVKTYALLDDASDTTFITSKVKKELGIEGVETTLNLSTMHGRQLIDVTRVDGLVAERPDKRAQVELPKTFAKNSIPSRKDQIPTPAVAEKWPHLQKIKDKIPELDDSLEVGLLIGSNCPKALKPKEVITGKSEDPYAVRTLLGWCIVGPVGSAVVPEDKDNLSEHTCNRTIVCETEDKDRGLKATANDYEDEFGTKAANVLRNDFYVDDGLKSVPTPQEAITLVKDVKMMCSKGGFNLHKFVSNSKEVLRSIPESDRAEGVKMIDLDLDSLPLERTLGVQWCVESDCFQFNIVLQNKPATRRGILSTVSSIYDPLGFVAPLLLQGKSILQELCRLGLNWDDLIPDTAKAEWERWKTELTQLQRITIPRCYKPKDFGHIVNVQLHHFSDASVKGYGQCSYVRLEDENKRIHCAFVTGKSRVAPLKPVTMPRLELTAAVCSVRVSQQIRRELEYHVDEDFYWTDSKVVLGYIRNESRRFHVFVANRIQEIHDSTHESQWRYIESKRNPADEASRGMKSGDLPDSRWLTGPPFLWKECTWQNSDVGDEGFKFQANDPEVKKSVTMVAIATPELKPASIAERIRRFSEWHKAKRAVALCVRYVRLLKARVAKGKAPEAQIDVEDIKTAERLIIRSAQAQALQDEIKILKNKMRKGQPERETMTKEGRKNVRRNSTLYKLDPFIDEHGIVRVGGRLKRAVLANDVKHPVILPKDSHVSSLLIRHFHNRVLHQGRATTLNEIRSNGYWIVGGSQAVNSAISACVTCRKLRGSVVEQKMADLPDDRLEGSTPFSYSAVDYFGPFMIKEGRKEIKRYGVVFTCMSSRAVHLEVAKTLETDSFINALRRFISRRGPIRQLRSDQGTNFVGARRELAQAVFEMDQQKIKSKLLEDQCDWFPFKMNVPAASHMGGIWERQIRSVRAILTALLRDNGSQLDEESLRTLMCEAELIVNSRPLTTDQMGDPDAPNPLTPNHLLTMKSKVVLPPPGVFQSEDLYCRKRWRRVQHLANEFWVRWRKEFLLSLQQRQKWNHPRRNLTVGDVVLVKEDSLPRNSWQLSRVVEAYPSEDGYVRKVKVATADGNLTKTGRRPGPVRHLERPVQKLILLLPAEEPDRGIPAEEPHRKG